GIVAYEQNKLSDAITYYKKAIALKVNYAYGNLGDIYLRLNKLQLAAYYYKKGLELSTGNDIYYMIGAHSNLGKLYTKAHNFPEAEKHLFKAKEIAETSGVTISQEKVYKNI